MSDQASVLWAAFQASPFVFLTAIAAIFVAAWGACYTYFKDRIERLKEDIERLERVHLSAPLPEPKDNSPAKARKLPRTPVRVPDHITAAALLDLYRDKTQLGGDRAAAAYKGNLLEVDGQIIFMQDFGPSEIAVTIDTGERPDSTDVMLIISDWEDRRRLEMLSKGDNISGSGIIAQIWKEGITLNPARLTV